MQVADLDAQLMEVVREVLGHLLGERRDEHPLAALDPTLDAVHQIVDLALGGMDLDARIDDAGRADELLHHLLAALELVGTGRRAHVDDLVQVRLELLERQRSVVQRGWQPEPEVDQDLLARAVVLVHAHDLGDGHVALVDHQQPVAREVVEQRPRPRAGLPARQVAGVILDARAEAELAHHLDVERGALAQALGLEHHAPGLELRGPLLRLLLDVHERLLHLVGGRDVVGRGIDVELLALREDLAGHRVELGDPFDLVAEELDADDEVVVGGLELERVPADAEAGTTQRLVVALVLEVHQLAQDAVTSIPSAGPHPDHGRAIVHRRAQAVDAADAGHDDDVAPLEQRPGGGVAELVDLLVAEESFSMYVSLRGRYASGW